jgi:ribosome-associated protein
MDDQPTWRPPVPNRKPPRLPESLQDPRTLALAIAQAAWSKNAYQTRIFDVRQLVDYTDMFVILTGRSERQVAAIADAIEAGLKEQGAAPAGIEGRKTATWILLDFGSVVVHVFEKATREYYDLDRLWADAPVIEVEEPAWVQDFARMEADSDL